MKERISSNAFWIFDGIGVAIITAIGGFLIKKHKRENKKNISISQNGGKKSINIQNNDLGNFNDRDDN